MPAKKLTPEQRAEAASLKVLFKAAQAERKEAGLPWTQEAIADELGFGQSALSQFLNGDIPLNAQAVMRFADVLGIPPGRISPIVLAQMQRAQAEAAEFLRRAQEMPRGRPGRKSSK